MLPHSLSFQLPRPSDHFVSRARGVFFGGGLSQDGRADQQVYRIGERQRRLLRVSLVAEFNAQRRGQQAGVPVSADLVEGGFAAKVRGAFQAIGWAARDVSHGSALREGFADDADQRDSFDFPAGEFAQHFDHRRSGSDHDQHRVVPLCLPLAHAHGSAVVRCGHLATEAA